MSSTTIDNKSSSSGHNSGHDAGHAHGHISLVYQPALPMSRGKTMLWLFLSTEIMFFSALIGTYIVVRFGYPPGLGPSRSMCMSKNGSGGQHLRLDLLQRFHCPGPRCSQTQSGLKAWRWVLVTLLLGCVFLGFKAYEYRAKYVHALLPYAPHSNIYDRADIYYVGAVTERLAELSSEINSANVRQNALVGQVESLPEELASLRDEVKTLRESRGTLAMKVVAGRKAAGTHPVMNRQAPTMQPRKKNWRQLRRN